MIKILPIEGLGRYLLSIDGEAYDTTPSIRWKTKDKCAGYRKMKTKIDKDGYEIVQLRHPDGKIRSHAIHALLAKVFISPSPFQGAIVRHLNDVKSDNSISNLAWGSRKDNARDAIRNGTMATGIDSRLAKLTEEDIMDIRYLRFVGATRESVASIFSITKTYLSRIWQNRVRV